MEQTQRADVSIRPTLISVEERLPEIEMIDGRIRHEVRRIFTEDVPPYFWLARSSESHHPPDERELGGTWLHTKRAFTAYMMLEPTYRAMSVIDGYEANCARAAVLLHDAFKYGQDPSDTSEDYHSYADGTLQHLPEYTQPSHDVDMAEFVRTDTQLPEEVARIIEAHGGSPDWYGHEGNRPSDDLELVVHCADMVASNSNHRLPVCQPTDVLREMTADDLPTIEIEDWE